MRRGIAENISDVG